MLQHTIAPFLVCVCLHLATSCLPLQPPIRHCNHPSVIAAAHHCNILSAIATTHPPLQPPICHCNHPSIIAAAHHCNTTHLATSHVHLHLALSLQCDMCTHSARFIPTPHTHLHLATSHLPLQHNPPCNTSRVRLHLALSLQHSSHAGSACYCNATSCAPALCVSLQHLTPTCIRLATRLVTTHPTHTS